MAGIGIGATTWVENSTYSTFENSPKLKRNLHCRKAIDTAASRLADFCHISKSLNEDVVGPDFHQICVCQFSPPSHRNPSCKKRHLRSLIQFPNDRPSHPLSPPPLSLCFVDVPPPSHAIPDHAPQPKYDWNDGRCLRTNFQKVFRRFSLRRLFRMGYTSERSVTPQFLRHGSGGVWRGYLKPRMDFVFAQIMR
jgi:hypothetical protein